MKFSNSGIAGLKRLAGAVAALVLASTVAATAVTITPGATPGVDTANPLATSTTGTVFQNVTGSVSGLRRSPWEGTALNSTGLYSSVSGGGTATFVFNRLVKSISFLWGSPDTYNNLDLGLSAGGILATVNGGLVQPPVSVGASFVTIGGIGLFDTVTFRSGTNAFEFANVTASPVPLPAAAVLLAGGLGGLGLLRRPRRRV